MNRAIIVSLAIALLCVAGCGAKTKSELIADAKLHERYAVEKNYQEAYRGIADKFVECSDSMAQYLQRNLYSELGEGELYLQGADSAGYIFLVEVKRISEDRAEVKAYSKVSTGFYPSYMTMTRMGALGEQGCPPRQASKVPVAADPIEPLT